MRGDEMPKRASSDDIDVLILSLLQDNARMSFAELAESVGLTAPAVAERVRRLERVGIISGYRAVIDPGAVSHPIHCIIRLNSSGDKRMIDTLAPTIPEIIECVRVTGSESHVIRAVVRSTEHLENLLELLWEEGDTVTSIVTSSPVPRRPLGVSHLDASDLIGRSDPG